MLTLLPAAGAQSTVSLFPGFGGGDRDLVGSIVGSGESATTFVVICTSDTITTAASATPTSSTDGADESDGEVNGCQFEELTLTQGPSTVRLPYTLDTITATIDCILDGTASAICIASQTGANDMLSYMTESMESVPSVITTTLNSDSITFVPVTITAGAAKGQARASVDTAVTANTAGGNVESTAVTKTGAVASNDPLEGSARSSSAVLSAAASTGGAAAFVAFSALGGFMAVFVGLAAATL